MKLISDAVAEYKSNSSTPDNYMSALAIDDNFTFYKVWFEIINPDCDDGADSCDWNHPSEIEQISPLDEFEVEELQREYGLITNEDAEKIAKKYFED